MLALSSAAIAIGYGRRLLGDSQKKKKKCSNRHFRDDIFESPLYNRHFGDVILESPRHNGYARNRHLGGVVLESFIAMLESPCAGRQFRSTMIESPFEGRRLRIAVIIANKLDLFLFSTTASSIFSFHFK